MGCERRWVIVVLALTACSNSEDGAGASTGGTGGGETGSVQPRVNEDCAPEDCPGGGECVSTSGWGEYCTYECIGHANCGCDAWTSLKQIAAGDCSYVCVEGRCEEVCEPGRNCIRGTCDPGGQITQDYITVSYCLIESIDPFSDAGSCTQDGRSACDAVITKWCERVDECCPGCWFSPGDMKECRAWTLSEGSIDCLDSAFAADACYEKTSACLGDIPLIPCSDINNGTWHWPATCNVFWDQF